MTKYLCEFSPNHIKVLHKNILQKIEIEKHIWIESEKCGRNVRIEATHEWIIKYAPLFNHWYEKEYGCKFRAHFHENILSNMQFAK